MALSCLVIAVSGVIFKHVAIGNDFWVSSFWEYIGLGLTGILIYLFIPKHRAEFEYMNKKGGRKIFWVNIVSELMTVAGNLLSNFALVLAPVAMVFLVGSFQPAIVLVLTVMGTKFFPHIVKEEMSRKTLIYKILAIATIVGGSALLFTS